MDDAAVVSALMAGDTIFFLQQQEAETRETSRDFERNGEADDATADDDYVRARISHVQRTALTNVLVYDECHLYAVSRIGRYTRRGSTHGHGIRPKRRTGLTAATTA